MCVKDGLTTDSREPEAEPDRGGRGGLDKSRTYEGSRIGLLRLPGLD